MLNKINKKFVIRCAIIICSAAVFILLVSGVLVYMGVGRSSDVESEEEPKLIPKLDYEVDLLDFSKYSRPGIALEEVNGVVVHYTANPGSDAVDNRNYFNNLEESNKGRDKPRYASAHFVIGLDGTILQCIPLSEMAYASNDRNSDTVAIECCHPKKNGKFNQETYDALLDTLVYLCIRFDLDPKQDVIRHYDVTGKNCPKYYVEHPDKWDELREDLASQIETTKSQLAAGVMPAVEDVGGK